MATSLIKYGILGTISLSAMFLHSRLGLFAQDKKPASNKSIQQIIRDVYTKVSTKQNMAIVRDLYQIQCLNSKEIIEPYQYTLKTGGKKIRLVMAVIVAQMFTGELPDDKVQKEIIQVGGLIQLLHSASLVIDDIEDGSLQRRGQPCSHLVYGLDRSINAANLMYFLAFKKLYDSIQEPYKKIQILKIFSEQMTISHMGQAQDVMVHKSKNIFELPSLQQYQLLTIAKTSSLLRMMVKMLCVILERNSFESERLCQVMNYVGLAFQVTDDVLNLTKNLGKGTIAEDLKQKKFTPIINSMRNNKNFMQLFIKDQKSDEDIKEMLEIISKSEALNQTKELAQKYELKAQQLIKKMRTPYSKQRFQKLMKFIITRQN